MNAHAKISELPQQERPISEEYGRLRVIGDGPVQIYKSGTRRSWRLRCECGNEITADRTSVKQGKIRSCGCLRRELAADQCRKHGLSHKPEFHVWLNMRRRCNDPKNNAFDRYGALGIKVCDEWQNDFAAFFSHVGPRPTPKHSLDRIQSEGNYEPGNVRWATAIEQNSNRKSARKFLLDGKRMTLREVCQARGLNHDTVAYRLRVLKWSFDDAIRQGDFRR